jgi:hypothetical protein
LDCNAKHIFKAYRIIPWMDISLSNFVISTIRKQKNSQNLSVTFAMQGLQTF